MKGSVQPVYQANFWRLGFSSFFFFLSFNLIIPELPRFISSFGGQDYKGMVIGLFALAAGISRPFSGKLVDTKGRKPVMVIGILVCIALGLFYPFVLNVWGFLILRFLHGFSTGFNPTGTVAYMADCIPADRRGEALGILGMMNNLGMSAGPALGSELAKSYGLSTMFMASSAAAVIALLLVLGLPEIRGSEVHARVGLRIRKEDVYDPRVKIPALVMLLSVFAFGAILTLIPDFAEGLGLKKAGYFFTAMTLSSVFVRIWSGRLSDKHGRTPVLIFGMSMLVLATVMIGMSRNVEMLLFSAVILGLASGTNSPALFAWAVDLSSSARIGRATATLFIALEAGIVLGSIIPAAIYANHSERLPLAFWSGSFMAALALIAMLRHRYQSAIKLE